VKTINWLLTRPVLVLIRCYRIVLSPHLGQACRFYPTCSVYAEQALLRHGFLKGGLLAAKRLLKCHPFHSGGNDPVPKRLEP